MMSIHSQQLRKVTRMQDKALQVRKRMLILDTDDAASQDGTVSLVLAYFIQTGPRLFSK